MGLGVVSFCFAEFAFTVYKAGTPVGSAGFECTECTVGSRDSRR